MNSRLGNAEKKGFQDSKIYKGRVVSVKSYGAFVAIPGFKENVLCHANHIGLEGQYVTDVAKEVRRGAIIWVRVFPTDKGRLTAWRVSVPALQHASLSNPKKSAMKGMEAEEQARRNKEEEERIRRQKEEARRGKEKAEQSFASALNQNSFSRSQQKKIRKEARLAKLEEMRKKQEVSRTTILWFPSA